MMINLEEFGELISKQEWAEKDGEIEYFNYLGKNKTYADDKFIFVRGERNGNKEFKLAVSIPEYESLPEIKFSTMGITSFSHILSIADAIRSGNGESLPVVIFGYHNAEEKDEETFQVKINEDTLLTILTIDKDHELIADKRYFADEKNKKDDPASSDFVAHYEFHDYGIYFEEVNESKLYLLNDEKSCFPESSKIELSNIIKNPLITTHIPNLNNLSGLIQFFNDGYVIYRIEPIYDDYGLVKDELYCLYEAYSFDEFEYPVFASSMHPFYFDNFDTGILPGPNRYCVDQIDRSIDLEDNTLIYSREIYEIKDEERRKLQELILEAKEKNEPCIPVID
jgi:hypothetical protein